jgi:hypothetical protein
MILTHVKLNFQTVITRHVVLVNATRALHVLATWTYLEVIDYDNN